MNEMIFKSEEFGKVRTYGVNGETWFVGQDVAHALGYRNTRTALAAHVEKEDKTTVLIQVDGTAYKTHAVVISESGLYALVMGSKLATARRFKHWITAEVLPAIADAVKGQMLIMVDGGIRTGLDVCKALALGADSVIMARPYVTAIYGGGAEGVKVLTDKIQAELADAMAMCGVHSLAEISRDMIF